MFKCKYKISNENYKELYKFTLKSKLKSIFITCAIEILIATILLVVSLTTSYNLLDTAIFVYIIAVIQFPLVALLSFITYKTTLKSQLEYFGKIEINLDFDQFEFKETDYSEGNLVGSSVVKYENIVKLGESKNIYYIFFTKYNCVMVPKNSFVEGECDKFADFIESKLPLKKK